MELILHLAACRCISLLLLLQCIIVLTLLANDFSLHLTFYAQKTDDYH